MKRILLLLVLVACTAPALAQRGALTIPRNLDQLTARSADIVRGTVISARVEKHPEFNGLNTVVVKLQVKETLKGQARNEFTFRQYIWDIRDGKVAAGYQKGQDLLLMMIAPSQYGLSSPAGLEQGRFVISRDKDGREVAVNGHGNFKLFDGISAQVAAKGIPLSPRASSLVQKHVKGPVELRDLTVLIRELAQAGQ
ncbi:MAG: hypothetical protein HW392_1746 [Steroidobacteraceae bacterium]|nr:hypothetical protein [Steroidobacteraceae bacterium]